MKKALIPLVCLTVSGCVSAPPQEQVKQAPAKIPADYKSQIKDRMKLTLVDPYSIKSPEITPPQPVFVGYAFGNGGYAPGVCYRFNPKNNYGAYNGMIGYAVGWVDGKPIAADGFYTKCVDWRPAPELVNE